MSGLGVGLDYTHTGGRANCQPPDRHQARVRYWVLPTTPNGSKPVQSWSGAAGAPNGDIYVAGMNYVDNAALYRLTPAGGDAAKPGLTLTYVGDAKAASQAAGNWQPGEPIEKFHTQPVWQGTRIYVANLNDLLLDNGYLSRRGFHWYGYDWNTKDSAISARQNQAASARRMAGCSASWSIAPATSSTGPAARPATSTPITSPAPRRRSSAVPTTGGRTSTVVVRCGWAARAGLFHRRQQPQREVWGAYNPAIFNHVHYYDPATGFGEERSWALHDQRAIDLAQCFGSPRTCYLMDNVGHVYRYAEGVAAAASWTYLGSIGQNQDEKFGLVWVFHVRADQRKAYILARRGNLFEFDLTSGAAKQVANLYTLEPAFKDYDFYGSNAWDTKGRFYFTAFPKPGVTPKNTRLVAIDPTRFVAAVEAAGR